MIDVTNDTLHKSVSIHAQSQKSEQLKLVKEKTTMKRYRKSWITGTSLSAVSCSYGDEDLFDNEEDQEEPSPPKITKFQGFTWAAQNIPG